MKAHLMFCDHDFDPTAPLPWNQVAVSEDLQLRTLLGGMALGDQLVFTVARTAILTGLGNDIETILYRQEILRDFLANPEALRGLYNVTVEETEKETNNTRSSLSRYPDWVLRSAIGSIETFLDTLEKLGGIVETHQHSFRSEGLIGLSTSLKSELSAEYCASVRDHLQSLRFRDGVLLGAELGKANKGGGHVLLEPPTSSGELWLTRFPGLMRLIERITGHCFDPYSFTLDPLDHANANALSSLRNRGLALAAGALGESADHIRGFLGMLRTELAFYVGCLNLHEQLTSKGEPICQPVPIAPLTRKLAFKGLFDPALALTLRQRVIGNDVEAHDKDLIFVTGANQAGKSTYLRSIGLAHLMMQCGMFVPAEEFCASLADGLATHYRREEDAAMESGKLDEELGRMSEILDHVTPHTIILFNESFAATNESEGSQIAHQIMSALKAGGIRMVCVTHFYELTQSFTERAADKVLFLRAERRQDGTRSFKVAEGEPLRMSFAEDLYKEVFLGGEPVTKHSPKRGSPSSGFTGTVPTKS